MSPPVGHRDFLIRENMLIWRPSLEEGRVSDTDTDTRSGGQEGKLSDRAVLM